MPSTAPADDTTKLAYLNIAIGEAGSRFPITEYSTTAATLDNQTFLYSMTALSPSPYRDVGIARVFIQEEATTTAPEVSHAVQQYYDLSADAWTLKFKPSIVSDYHGKVVNVQYQYPPPLVAALSTTVYLPITYLAYKICETLAITNIGIQTTDNQDFIAQSQMWGDKAEKVARQMGTGLMPGLPQIHPQRLV